MRKFILNFLFWCIPVLLVAQAKEGTIEYKKKKQACLFINYNFPPEAVENALMGKLSRMGYKGREEKGMFNKDKGFNIYKEATLTDISPGKYDYVVNIERKSKKERDETVLYLLVFNNDVNALPLLSREETGKAKSFLEDLTPEVEEANIDILIAAQMTAIGNAEKKMKQLQTDSVELQKKLLKLQEEVLINSKAQETQVAEIANQKKILEAIQSRKKN
ncbi:MAG TPA: hypothetical protein VJ765_09165 [Chitinophagaceae bacterium]|nr:hypothetical protein [Chitinophagaceae bacterium]